MPIYRRFLLLISCAVITIFLIYRNRKHAGLTAQLTAQDATPAKTTNLGEWMYKYGASQQGLTIARPPTDPSAFETGPDMSNLSSTPSPFRPGTPKPPGSTYTRAVIMGKLSSENTTWLESVDLPASIQKYIYNVDKKVAAGTTSSNPTTLLTLPTIKGHEAMVYLTYIIDHYTQLPDINIFLHAHQLAWHNNELLNHNAVEIVKRLSSERVRREGYMNLRCHWKPGCPDYIYPRNITRSATGSRIEDPDKREEAAIADAWDELFPDDPVPDVLSAPCCAQFAVSRERVLEVPLRRFVEWRDWLVETPLSDYVSGRVFEYLWQKIFVGVDVVCPDMRVCYCDGFGVCFENAAEFDHWFELRWRKREAEENLAGWRESVERLKKNKKEKGRWTGRFGGEKSGGTSFEGNVPAVDGEAFLQGEIDRYSTVLEERRVRALLAGTDPRVRARVAGRVWRDGDGY